MARSIFLQGQLITNNIDKKFFQYESELSNWFDFCKKEKLDPINGALNFVRNLNFVDMIVIGVSNKKELNEILLSYKNKKKINFENFCKLKKNKIDLRKL